MVVPSIMFQTLLVTGGSTYGGYLSSTEVLEETAAAWSLAQDLPSPRDRLAVANINNRLLATGTN